MRSLKLLSATAVALLVLAAASGLMLPVKANDQELYCAASVEPKTVDVAVGSTFSVQIWLRNLDVYTEDFMTSFYFTLSWDPSMIEFTSRTLTLVQGWSSTSEKIESDWYYLRASSSTLFSSDASWVTLTFRCLGAGRTQIAPITAVIYVDALGMGCDTLPATVNQHGAVGGALYDVNKLAILSPWLAVIGLVGCMAIVVVVTKKRRL